MRNCCLSADDFTSLFSCWRQTNMSKSINARVGCAVRANITVFQMTSLLLPYYCAILMGMKRLCSATFEQLLALWGTLCSTSNLGQLLPSLATFEQQIDIKPIQTAHRWLSWWSIRLACGRSWVRLRPDQHSRSWNNKSNRFLSKETWYRVDKG